MTRRRTLLLTLCCILISGCADFPPPTGIPLTEAHKKFINILDEDYDLAPMITAFDNTVWVYMPLKESLFAMKATMEGPQHSNEPSRVLSVNYLEGVFADRTFTIDYDISPMKMYTKSFGYNSNYSEKYQTIQRNILTAISRAFTEVDAASGENVPSFFAIVVADVVNGIEISTFLYLEDLKRGMSDHTFMEEYVKRSVSEYPIGGKEIIGDLKGKHVKYYDLSWGNFLIKQVLHRIRFQYRQSDFKPGAETVAKDEILKTIALVVQTYNFEDFDGVVLNNLFVGVADRVNRKELR